MEEPAENVFRQIRYTLAVLVDRAGGSVDVSFDDFHELQPGDELICEPIYNGVWISLKRARKPS